MNTAVSVSTRFDRDALLRFLDGALLFAVLLMESSAVISNSPFEKSDYIAQVFEGNRLWQFSCLALFAYALGRTLAGNLLPVVELALRSKLLIALLALCIVSTLWSVTPEITFRRSVALAGFALCLYYYNANYSLRATLQVAGFVACVLVLVSAVLIIAFPAFGTMGSGEYAGAWRGVFWHKNIFAKAMIACLVILWICWTLSSGAQRWLFGGCLALAGILLAGSRSVTVYGTAAALALFVAGKGCFLRSRFDGLFYVFCLSLFMAVTVLAIAILGTDWIFDLIGRKPSLTGRTLFWNFIWSYIAERPLSGFGYGSFWSNASGEIDFALMTQGWMPSHAHNGLLELWIDTGVFGVALFSVLLLLQIVLSSRDFIRARTMTETWPFLMTLLFVIINLTEVAIAKSYEFLWPLFLCAYLQTIKAPRMPAHGARR